MMKKINGIYKLQARGVIPPYAEIVYIMTLTSRAGRKYNIWGSVWKGSTESSPNEFCFLLEYDPVRHSERKSAKLIYTVDGLESLLEFVINKIDCHWTAFLPDAARKTQLGATFIGGVCQEIVTSRTNRAAAIYK